MTNLTRVTLSPLPRLQDGASALNSSRSQKNADVRPPPTYIADDMAGDSTAIFNLVQMNLSPESAVEYSLLIKTALAGHGLSIANDRPRDVLQVFEPGE